MIKIILHTYNLHNLKPTNLQDTFKIHPVKFENRLPIKGKGCNSDSEKLILKMQNKINK